VLGNRGLYSLGYINYRESIATIRLALRGLPKKLERRRRVVRGTPFSVFRACLILGTFDFYGRGLQWVPP